MRQTKEEWVFSLLSDAQELISRDCLADAIETLNNAKRVLSGQYEEYDNGYAIEVN